MKDNKVISFKGSNGKIAVIINNSKYEIITGIDDISNFNVRIIINTEKTSFFFNETVFGEKIQENKSLYKGVINSFVISDYNEINLAFIDSINTNLIYDVYADYPINNYDVLNAIPLPTNVLTIVLNFNSEIKVATNQMSKYFDAYSHLGFCLVDLEEMKSIIDKEYGRRDIDLIDEFTKSDLIDKLFEEGVIVITWGINPYTYPIYSIENKKNIIEFFDESYDGQKGIYKITENIKKLSIIPGNALKNWEEVCNKDWEKITLYGNGEKVILEPRKLEDFSGETTISSFLIYRSDIGIEDSPLLNIDLLYS